MDVCLVSPAVESDELDRVAELNSWSRLTTRANQPSLAVNLTMLRHPGAQYIYKVDEDIFVGDQFFDRLLEGHRRVAQEGRYQVGFSAPVLNTNGTQP